MHVHQKIHNAMALVEKVVDYFRQHDYHQFGHTIKRAAAEVLAEGSGVTMRHRYNKQINSTLCEALLTMNYHKDCPDNYRLVMGKLIESYRDMNGMPSDDYLVNTGEISPEFSVEVRGPESFDEFANEIEGEEQCESDGYCDFIINNTEVGGEYSVEDVMQDSSNEIGFKTEDDTLEAIKTLVSLGYFEVTERDSMNGKISHILRVR